MSEKSDAAVMVSEVIGEGDDAHRLVHMDAWSFKIWEAIGDGEPRFRDVDAAALLGFGRPRDVRKLIERTWPGDKITEIYKRATVARYEIRPGVHHPGQGNDEYWLTEAQLLKLIARSETANAEAILDDMIRVYMAVRRGLLLSAASAPSLPQICVTMAEHVLAFTRAGDVEGTLAATAALNALHTALPRAAHKPLVPKPSTARRPSPSTAQAAPISPPSADAPAPADDSTRGQRLKALRLRLGLTQEGMYEKGGLGRVEVVRVESGHNQATSYRLRAGLARATDLSLEDLVAYLEGKIDLDEALGRRTAPLPGPQLRLIRRKS